MFWGWQTGHWRLAAVLALALEGGRWSKVRLEFRPEDIKRIIGLCLLVLGGIVIYNFGAGEGRDALTGVFGLGSSAARATSYYQLSQLLLNTIQLAPLILLPLGLAQTFAGNGNLDLSAVAARFRRGNSASRDHQAPEAPALRVNLSYPYFAACIVGASAANQPGLGFFYGLCGLMAWATWPGLKRPNRWLPWVALFALAAGLGYVGQAGLRGLRDVFDDLAGRMLSRGAGTGSDLEENRTALGSIGRLKLSSRIALRIGTDGGPPPALFREASYNAWRSNTWYRIKSPFQPLATPADETTWILTGNRERSMSARIARYLPRGRGLLAYPNGTTQVNDFRAVKLETNRLAVLRVDEGPGLATYTVWYGDGTTFDAAPDRDDLEIPRSERAVLERVALELGLAQQPPEQAVGLVADFFARQFRYTTFLTTDHRATNDLSALGVFLTRNRAGHCEYFATATTLLLRQAGIPARYVTGFAVQESSSRSSYVARRRDAHAWTLAYLNGQWRQIDNTPGSWYAVESAAASWWEPVQDFLSYLWFQFSQWRWNQSGARKYFILIGAAILIFLAARLLWKRPWQRSQPRRPSAAARAPVPGEDSEFYAVEATLAAPAE